MDVRWTWKQRYVPAGIVFLFEKGRICDNITKGKSILNSYWTKSNPICKNIGRARKDIFSRSPIFFILDETASK